MSFLLLIWYLVAAYFIVLLGGINVLLLWVAKTPPGLSSGTVRLRSTW